MRKFKRRQPRGLPFRLLAILTGALLLLAAFAPCANAQGLLRFYDFEGPVGPPYPVSLGSHAPALETGPFTSLNLETGTDGVPYPAGRTTAEVPGLNLNLPPGAAPNLVCLGIHRAGLGNLNMEMPFLSAVGIYDITSVSLAVGCQRKWLRFSWPSDEHRWRTRVCQYPRSARPDNSQRPGISYNFHCPVRNDSRQTFARPAAEFYRGPIQWQRSPE